MIAKRKIHLAVLSATVFSGAATITSPALAQQNKQVWDTIDSYCMECHNSEDWAGSLAFDLMAPDDIHGEAEVWEAVIRKLNGGLMPPPG